MIKKQFHRGKVPPNKANAGELLILALIESWFGIKHSVNCKAHRKPAIAKFASVSPLENSY